MTSLRKMSPQLPLNHILPKLLIFNKYIKFLPQSNWINVIFAVINEKLNITLMLSISKVFGM